MLEAVRSFSLQELTQLALSCHILMKQVATIQIQSGLWF